MVLGRKIIDNTIGNKNLHCFNCIEMLPVVQLKSCVQVSIIGSAGRKSDQCKMSLQLYNEAIDKTMDIIKEKLKVKFTNISLVSGGAAWTG